MFEEFMGVLYRVIVLPDYLVIFLDAHLSSESGTLLSTGIINRLRCVSDACGDRVVLE